MHAPLASRAHHANALEDFLSKCLGETGGKPLHRVPTGDQSPGNLEGKCLGTSSLWIPWIAPVKNEETQGATQLPRGVLDGEVASAASCAGCEAGASSF